MNIFGQYWTFQVKFKPIEELVNYQELEICFVIHFILGKKTKNIFLNQSLQIAHFMSSRCSIRW